MGTRRGRTKAGNARREGRGARGLAIAALLAVSMAMTAAAQQAKPAAAENGQENLPKTKAAPTLPAPKLDYPKEIARVTFAAAGDVIPHQAVAQAAAAEAKLETSALATASAAAPAAGQPGEAAPGVGAPAPASGAIAKAASDSATPAAPTPAPAAVHTGNDAGWDDEFADVADVFRSVDFGFVNMETPVAPKHSIGSKAFQFEAPVALIDALKYSGVKIVSFANNHVFDQGYAGFDETLEHLRAEGMLFTGSGDSAENASKPVVIEKNGIKIGFLGMTRWLNGHRNPEKEGAPHVAFFPYPGESNGAPGQDEAGVLEAIKAARAECDFLIVSIHWGIEYAPAPRPEDEEAAHKFLEAGAGMVIGHHPHVLQPMETYQTQDGRQGVTIYSLGNFLSNQSRDYVNGLAPDKDGDPRDEMMVKFSVVKRDYGPGGTRVELADVGAIPIWEENNHLRYRSGKDKVPEIKPEFIDRLIPILQAHLDQWNQLPQPLTAEQQQEFVQVTKELDLLRHRREIILNRVGDDFIVAPPAQ
ncbi:MAG TPA: CapA family protein [Candidatus Acidoferrales bacterium]|nr:CapA family protein [Candidatus Acidoferrales bacterium]